MTTLSAARTRAYANSHINGLPILTSTTIWAGGAVGINPITRAVRALVGGDLFVGFAQSSVNHVLGQQRDTAVSLVQSGQVTLAVSGAVQADVGKDVYATDDDTFTLSSTGASFVGVAKQLVSAGKLLVEIAPPSMLNVVRRSSDGTALVSGAGNKVPFIPATRPRLLIVGNSIAGQSCRAGASYTSRVATAAGSGVKPGSNQITLVAGGVAALSLSPNDYIVVQTANQQPWPVQVTAIAGELLTLAKRLPWTVRTVSSAEAGVSKVTAPILFGGTWRQTFGIHNYANALAGGLFEVVPGYGHGAATAAEILAVLPQHLQFYRPAVVMLSLFENDVPGSLTAAQMIALADQAAILCTSAGARPIVLHSLPTFSLGGGREDEYDDLKAGILAIATRVPGAIGLDPGSIYLDTSIGATPRCPLPGWTDASVHPLESKRATIALSGGLVAALTACAPVSALTISKLLYGANPPMAGTGGTASTGTTGTVAAGTTITCAGTGLSAVASKNTDDTQRVVGADAGAITAGSEIISVAQALTLPVTWNLRTRLKMVCEVTIHSQTNLGALRLSTAFGAQTIDLRTSASSSEAFDTALVGNKFVLESMPFPMCDPATTSATLTLDFRTLTGTGFAVDATVHSMGFALAQLGEVDDGALALL